MPGCCGAAASAPYAIARLWFPYTPLQFFYRRVRFLRGQRGEAAETLWMSADGTGQLVVGAFGDVYACLIHRVDAAGPKSSKASAIEALKVDVETAAPDDRVFSRRKKLNQSDVAKWFSKSILVIRPHDLRHTRAALGRPGVRTVLRVLGGGCRGLRTRWAFTATTLSTSPAPVGHKPDRRPSNEGTRRVGRRANTRQLALGY